MWPFARKGPTPPSATEEHEAKLACSFCGKSRDEVRKLIAGPTVYICDECIDLCNDIIAEECDREEAVTTDAPGAPAGPDPWWTAPLVCPVCRLPKSSDDVLFVAAQRWICRACVDLVKTLADDPPTSPSAT